jgi:hypothetical protein
VPDLGHGISCSARGCAEATEAVAAAQDASLQGNRAAADAQRNLEAGKHAARKVLMNLRSELAQLLAPDDNRWYAFGFDRPCDPAGPRVPRHLVLSAGVEGSGMLLAHRDPARRAESYRVRVQNAQGETLQETIAHDTDAVITGLTPGATVTATVSARNGTGESQPCEGVEMVVA